MNYERMDSILKQLEDIKNCVNNAEDAYGEIVPQELWKQLFSKLIKEIEENAKQEGRL